MYLRKQLYSLPWPKFPHLYSIQLCFWLKILIRAACHIFLITGYSAWVLMLKTLLRPRCYSWKHISIHKSFHSCSQLRSRILHKTESISSAGVQAASWGQQGPCTVVWLAHWSSHPPELRLQWIPDHLFTAVKKYLNCTWFESTFVTKSVGLVLFQPGLLNTEPSKEWVCFATGWVSCSCCCLVTQAQDKWGNISVKEEGRVNFIGGTLPLDSLRAVEKPSS